MSGGAKMEDKVVAFLFADYFLAERRLGGDDGDFGLPNHDLGATAADAR